MENNGNPATKLVVALVDDSLPPSYKVGVQTSNDETWVYNGLRFARQDDAATYARDLLLRWPAIYKTAVHPSEDRPNATFPMPSDRYAVAGRG